ncbi:MAG: FAD-dependent oxidoreductase [Pseudomonadales bacterium]|nr:FAD-dependent oxidoreductase [Pseudomonadales bacterium]
MKECDFLIIGAGMAGLTAATQLHSAGHRVVCVDKARGSGGRLSSKRVDLADITTSVDLGCPGFSATSPLFQAQVREWQAAGCVSVWHREHAEAMGQDATALFVGSPRSSSLTRYLANQVEIDFSQRITRLEYQGGRWYSYSGRPGTDDEEVCFSVSDAVILATPPRQAADLLPQEHPLQEALQSVEMIPQWVVILAVKGVVAAPERIRDTLRAQDQASEGLTECIYDVTVDHQKPGRVDVPGFQLWQIQARPDWSAENIDLSPDLVCRTVVLELEARLGMSLGVVTQIAHRWLYSLPPDQKLSSSQNWIAGERLGICGDYIQTDHRSGKSGVAGVESAYLSAADLVQKIKLQKSANFSDPS